MKTYRYRYPRPMLTADVVTICWRDGDLAVLLIRRAHPPYRNRWAFPGGFVEENEPLEDAARRELKEETGLAVSSLDQFHAFGDPGRDPRGHVVTVAYLALLGADGIGAQTPRAGSDAADLGWFPVHHLPPLAFDHARILSVALERMRSSRAAPFLLLPRRFTVEELRRICMAIYGKPIDRRTLARVLGTVLDLRPLKQTRVDATGRRHHLYTRPPGRMFRRLETIGFPF